MKKPLLSEMTLREKIGQTILPYQYDINRKTEVDAKILRTKEEKAAFLRERQFGTLWVQPGAGSRGFDISWEAEHQDESEEFRQWILEEDACLKIHALVATDAEGGIGWAIKDLSNTPNAAAIGAANSPELTYQLGQAVGRELRCAGINWIWGPVVDICGRFGSNTRSYCQNDPERMVTLANAYIRGLQSVGVAATAKHFPGGDRYEYRDAHYVNARIFSSEEEWWSEQGKIFQGVLDDEVYSVMISHHAFPAVDDTKLKGKYLPATLSYKIITELLKEKMGFKGVVITDSIAMAGLVSFYKEEDLIVELIKAGNDVLLGVRTIHAVDILEKAVLDGRISESRIDDACQRVLDMKEKMGMFTDEYWVEGPKAEELVPQTREICKAIAQRSITLVRDGNNLLPLNKDKIKKVTIICSSHKDSFFTNLELVKKEFEARGAEVHLQRRLKNNEELEAIDKDSDLILYAVYIGGHQPKGWLTLFGEECQTYMHAFSSGAEKSIGVSMGYPYVHYNIMESADTFVNAYNDDPEQMKAFVAALYGEIPMMGISPVELDPGPIRN